MRRVIIESPYAGDVERNEEYARRCMKDSLDRGEAPYLSHLLYPQVLDDTDPDERKKGIEAGLAIGAVMDATIVYEDYGLSSGMRKGMRRAHNQGRFVEYRRIGKNPPKSVKGPEITNNVRCQLDDAVEDMDSGWFLRVNRNGRVYKSVVPGNLIGGRLATPHDILTQYLTQEQAVEYLLERCKATESDNEYLAQEREKWESIARGRLEQINEREGVIKGLRRKYSELEEYFDKTHNALMSAQSRCREKNKRIELMQEDLKYWSERYCEMREDRDRLLNQASEPDFTMGKVLECARCGGTHYDVPVYKFKNGECCYADRYATCPTLNESLLVADEPHLTIVQELVDLARDCKGCQVMQTDWDDDVAIFTVINPYMIGFLRSVLSNFGVIKKENL